jgi:hypothetical protein
MIPLVSGMLSSLLMGGIKSLLGGGQQAAGGAGIPTSITGMPIGRAPVLPGLANYPRYADGGLMDYLDIQGGGSIAPIEGGYAGGGGGRIGLNIPLLEGILRAGASGTASGYDLESPYGDASGFDTGFSGADIGYTTPGGASYGATYSQNPAMDGGMDREFMLNYSTPFADGGVMSIPSAPPGETPQMAYAMDKGGMIRGPGGGVDDLIGGSIDNRNKVLLSDGEFVIPARVVSALGDGSSEAGAKVLDGMIRRVKSEADDRLKDNGNINLNKVMPA